ncbi:hypothetical protein RKK48_003470 [Vibrio cholerae]|uniref:hypothetical protein n=1 Tax=Vibrio cholerae TaxID=666 RepID=UPI00215F2D67|nr:hypothetical protein [Vibrio cholerae]ELD3372202.1 hypothetical protein [Vibrio cholerae]MCS0097612.1 hypothetical protein [Vibrio cholerae]
MKFEQVKQRIDLLEHFDYSLALFEANYHELISIIDFMCNERVGVELFSITNRWKLHECQVHLGFKLHNYVCAAKSLIDHSRVLYSRLYKKNEINFDGYEDQVKIRFVDNSLSKFIEFLRSYSQHEKLPTISSSFSFDSQSDEGFVFKVLLVGDELMKSSQIKSQAKAYIRENEELDIRKVLSDYHNQVREFYEWVKARQNEIHKDDLAAINEFNLRNRVESLTKFIDSFVYEGMRGTVQERFYEVLTPEEFKALDKYKNDNKEWLENALQVIKEQTGISLPTSIQENLLAQCVQ